ncbi:hypothetical protein PS2_031729 [Malus domestica]
MSPIVILPPQASTTFRLVSRLQRGLCEVASEPGEEVLLITVAAASLGLGGAHHGLNSGVLRQDKSMTTTDGLGQYEPCKQEQSSPYWNQGGNCQKI